MLNFVPVLSCIPQHWEKWPIFGTAPSLLYRLPLHIVVLLFSPLQAPFHLWQYWPAAGPFLPSPYSPSLAIYHFVSVSFLAQLAALGNALTRWQWRYRSQDLNVSLRRPDKDHRLVPGGMVMKGHSFVCTGMSVCSTISHAVLLRLGEQYICGKRCVVFSIQTQSQAYFFLWFFFFHF